MSASIVELRIQESLQECDKHVNYINEAYSKLTSIFPVTEKNYNKITSDDVMALDQLIYRFTKLQDKIGTSLIKTICILLEGDNDQRTFIDNLNILEKHNLLDNKAQWDELREMRNTLTHDYPNDISFQIEKLNKVIQCKETLVSIYSNIKNKFRTL